MTMSKILSISKKVVVVKMNYSVHNLNGINKNLTGKRIKFNDKSFYYWHNNSQQKIEQANIIFHANDGNIAVQNGVVILCLEGLKTPQDISDAINIFKHIQENKSVQFQFIVGTREEQQIAMMVANQLNLRYKIKNKNAPQAQAVNPIVQQTNKDQELSAYGSETITYNRNGLDQKVTIHEGHAYEDNSTLSIQEQKIAILKKWKQDPIMQAKLATMSPEEIESELMKTIRLSKTTHYLESASEQVLPKNKVGQVATEQARKVGGTVNQELGIISNNNSATPYSIVEENGDNHQLVTADVERSNISTGPSSSTSITSSGGSLEEVNNQEKPELKTENTQEQSRNVEQVFYVDEEYYLYNESGNKIGKIGTDGYMISYEDNTIQKDGQVIGTIGDYKEMGKSNKANIYKPPVRTRTLTPDKRAAFVSLPLIIFIISALLLIASAVLLFVLD